MNDFLERLDERTHHDMAIVADIRENFRTTYVGGGVDGGGTFYGDLEAPGRVSFIIVPPAEHWHGTVQVKGLEPVAGLYRLIVGDHERARAATVAELAAALA